MKCPHCNQEHPDGFQFCPVTGEKIEILFTACNNPSCPEYGKMVLPLDAVFCPVCGQKIEKEEVYEYEDEEEDYEIDAPFHIQHPEYDLIPYTEYKYKDKISFIFNKPEYIEDASRYEGMNYYFIARKGKIGILRYEYHEHWYGDDHYTERIIPCEYDRIEKESDYFICWKDGKKCFIDRKGKIMK